MDWTEVTKPKKKKVTKKPIVTSDDQKTIMKEMQGFKNWTEKESGKNIETNTGKFSSLFQPNN